MSYRLDSGITEYRVSHEKMRFQVILEQFGTFVQFTTKSTFKQGQPMNLYKMFFDFISRVES